LPAFGHHRKEITPAGHIGPPITWHSNILLHGLKIIVGRRAGATRMIDDQCELLPMNIVVEDAGFTRPTRLSSRELLSIN
jgi:hypothetical protein